MHEENKTRQPEWLTRLVSRQKNTVWPDVPNNSRGVDEFLWKGSSNATRVQRVGAVIFGLFFIIAALAFGAMAAEVHSFMLAAFALGWLYVGIRVFSNSRTKAAKKHSHPSERTND